MIPTFKLDDMSDENRQKLTERSRALEKSIIEKTKEVIKFVKTFGDKALIKLTCLKWKINFEYQI